MTQNDIFPAKNHRLITFLVFFTTDVDENRSFNSHLVQSSTPTLLNTSLFVKDLYRAHYEATTKLFHISLF